MKRNNCENGRSMVEMMGYMAVVMSVIVAVGKIVTNAFNEHKYSQASIQLGELAVSVAKAGAIEKDYSSVISSVNDKKKLVPTSFRVAGNKIFHVFGGEVDLSVDSSEPDKFSVTYKGLRRKQCIELAMKDWRRNKNVDLYALGVNGEYFYWPVYKKDSNSLPMTRAKLTGTSENDKGACSKDTGNTITWIFN